MSPATSFSPLMQNVPLLKQFLIDSFLSTTFNKSIPFSSLSTPPAHIHLSPDAIPYACHTPAVVPKHWENQVKDALDRDVQAGTIEEVPIGDPVVWCSRMVVVPKKDGTPRRVVDFQKLNTYCLRETHFCHSPFVTASRVPAEADSF